MQFKEWIVVARHKLRTFDQNTISFVTQMFSDFSTDVILSKECQIILNYTTRCNNCGAEFYND